MKRKQTVKKIIFGLLDILLIIGAILSILTIDRGKWITSNPAFYDSEGQGNPVIQNAPDSSVDTGAKLIPQTGQSGEACMTAPEVTNPYWYNSSMWISPTRIAAGSGSDQGNGGKPEIICAK